MVERTQYDPLGAPLFENRYTYSSWRGLTTGFEREDLPPPPAPSILWSWEYRYNAMGEREQKREMQSPSGADSLPGHSWTYYLLNGTKEQLSVWSGASATTAGTCSWLSGPVAYLYPSEYLVYAVEYPGIREDIPRVKLTPDGVPEYRITDHLASVRQTLDENGQTVNQLDYEPFGAVLSSQGVERQAFNSREHDGEDGLSNNGVRKLDEGLGRFVAVDPMWEEYSHLSVYIYVGNAPVQLTDPTGMTFDFSKSTDPDQAERDFMTAMDYLQGTVAGTMLRLLHEDPNVTISVNVASPMQTFDAEYGPGGDFLFWDPKNGLAYVDANGEEQIISPAVVLGHEAGHMYVDQYGTEEMKTNLELSDPDFGKVKERWAIIFVEFPTASDLGEVTAPRVDHSGSNVLDVNGGVTGNER